MWVSTAVMKVQRAVINLVFAQEFYHQRCLLCEVLGCAGEQGTPASFLVNLLKHISEQRNV